MSPLFLFLAPNLICLTEVFKASTLHSMVSPMFAGLLATCSSKAFFVASSLSFSSMLTVLAMCCSLPVYEC